MSVTIAIPEISGMAIAEVVLTLSVVGYFAWVAWVARVAQSGIQNLESKVTSLGRDLGQVGTTVLQHDKGIQSLHDTAKAHERMMRHMAAMRAAKAAKASKKPSSKTAKRPAVKIAEVA